MEIDVIRYDRTFLCSLQSKTFQNNYIYLFTSHSFFISFLVCLYLSTVHWNFFYHGGQQPLSYTTSQLQSSVDHSLFLHPGFSQSFHDPIFSMDSASFHSPERGDSRMLWTKSWTLPHPCLILFIPFKHHQQALLVLPSQNISNPFLSFL